MNICGIVLNELPTYLQDLFVNVCDEAIYLVFLHKDEDENICSPNTKVIFDPETTLSLDITGNPLEVDLKEEESLMIENFQLECVQHWTENENTHFPLPIKDARNYLNSKSKHKTSDHIFVVCNGNNSLKTIILGVREIDNKIYNCTVNVLGCFTKNHERISTTSMEKSHLLLTRNNQSSIKYVVTFKYFIFGTFLQNIKHIEKTEHFGSICVETRVNKKCNLDYSCSMVDSMKLIVQIIAGHKKSSINFLWEDLICIYNLLKILNDNKEDPDTVICKNPLQIEDIYKHVNEMVHSNWIRREKVEFSLENIRMPNIMDKLWNTLKNCENLRILRDVFHYFFEELAESGSNIKLPEDNTSNMATIINGILDGKLAVPTIDYTEALKFLVEIGSEKLKNDYQIIFKQFYLPAANCISSKWSEFECKLALEETHRKTRITHHLKGNKNTVEKCMAKLSYLSKLHIALDYIYLVKNYTFLSEVTFDFICERICKFYVAKNNIIHEFKDLLDKPICGFNVVLNNGESNIVEGKIPDFCSVRMTSQKVRLEVQTVYMLSKYIIFPLNIYNDYDIIEDKENNHLYYAYKMESLLVTT